MRMMNSTRLLGECPPLNTRLNSHFSCRRQVPQYQGGFLLDGGVHFVAGLRDLLVAGGEHITHLAAFSSLLERKLAPVDTIHTTLRISNGNNGTFNLSFGTEFKSGFEIEVITDKGAVIVRPTEVVVTTKDEKGEKKEDVRKFEFGAGVKPEILALAESLKEGKLTGKASSEEALMDLRILQSMLESGENGGKVKEVA
jgi:predicted dehydrogenase